MSNNDVNLMNKSYIELDSSNCFDFKKEIYEAHRVLFSQGHILFRGIAKIPMGSITGIEIHKPFLTRNGIIKFIIDGKRYVTLNTTKPLQDFIFTMRAFKNEFHILMQIVERIQKVNPDCTVKICKGLRLAFDVPVVEYKGEYVTSKTVYKDFTPKKVDNTPYTPPKVYTDYESPTKKDSSVIGSAIVGGVVAGPAGAVVGALHAVNKNSKNK